MAKVNSQSISKTFAAIWRTIVWAVFIIVGGFSALTLRGNIDPNHDTKAVFGSILAAFVLGALFTVIYKAHKEK